MGFYLRKSFRAGPIRFKPPLDVEVDHDRQLLVLTRDDVATPTCLTTPDALRAGAIVAALTEQR